MANFKKEAIELYLSIAKVKGSNSNKFNRAAKLLYNIETLDQKFRGIVARGIESNTEHSRCALALLLMLHTGIRVGNEGSAEGYMTKPHPNQKDAVPKFVQTYGLTTLLIDHVTVRASKVKLMFLGKKQVDNYFSIGPDKDLAYWIVTLQNNSEDSNSKTLFNVTDYQLTKFIKKYVGSHFSPKDFRCARANYYACSYIVDYFEATYKTKKTLKEDIKAMYGSVSEQLNNTLGVCKKSYVHPDIPIWAENNLLN